MEWNNRLTVQIDVYHIMAYIEMIDWPGAARMQVLCGPTCNIYAARTMQCFCQLRVTLIVYYYKT